MKNLDYVLLLDCYGSLLTERQRALLEGYYCEDLSLAELAEPIGISRAAVYDSIRRGEKKLEEFEQQMGIAARLNAVRALLSEIGQIGAELPAPQSRRIAEAVERGMRLLNT